MIPNDDIMADMKKHWPAPGFDHGLASRIAENAVRQPQYRPWWMVWQNDMDDMFGQWRMQLSYKLAGLAVCAFVGLASGWYQNAADWADNSQDDIALLAFIDTDMLEGI